MTSTNSLPEGPGSNKRVLITDSGVGDWPPLYREGETILLKARYLTPRAYDIATELFKVMAGLVVLPSMWMSVTLFAKTKPNWPVGQIGALGLAIALLLFIASKSKRVKAIFFGRTLRVRFGPDEIKISGSYDGRVQIRRVAGGVVTSRIAEHPDARAVALEAEAKSNAKYQATLARRALIFEQSKLVQLIYQSRVVRLAGIHDPHNADRLGIAITAAENLRLEEERAQQKRAMSRRRSQ